MSPVRHPIGCGRPAWRDVCQRKAIGVVQWSRSEIKRDERERDDRDTTGYEPFKL
jgi:hypothetical protein